jgi:hypothetical protein
MIMTTRGPAEEGEGGRRTMDGFASKQFTVTIQVSLFEVVNHSEEELIEFIP